jgi:hypothetical protein
MFRLDTLCRFTSMTLICTSFLFMIWRTINTCFIALRTQLMIIIWFSSISILKVEFFIIFLQNLYRIYCLEKISLISLIVLQSYEYLSFLLIVYFLLITIHCCIMNEPRIYWENIKSLLRDFSSGKMQFSM